MPPGAPNPNGSSLRRRPTSRRLANRSTGIIDSLGNQPTDERQTTDEPRSATRTALR
jgi:hypothetical protein